MSISGETNRTEYILVRTGIDSERIDGKRGSGLLANVTGCGEIQRLWPGIIGGDRSGSPNIRGLLSVRRWQWVEEGGQWSLLVRRLHDERVKAGKEMRER